MPDNIATIGGEPAMKRGESSRDQHLESIWFGTGYLTKARAHRIAAAKANAWKN
jgi:hypothetical protein